MTNNKNVKDYSKNSKEELVQEIESRDIIIKKLKKRKKYGLVWDDEFIKEYFETQMEIKFPILKNIKKNSVECDSSDQTHILIEGDNYHALSVLNYTHKGRIDIIYIDPPYNNGKKTWKYNNDYVDKNDTYKHSKWISFMDKRLRLAKKLLTKDGVLVCAVDHHEQEVLGLILDEIFPSFEKTCVVIIHNPAGQQGDNFSYTHEFAYFIYPKNKKCINLEFREPIIANFRDWGGIASKRNNGKNCFYPIYIKNEKIIGFGDVCDDSFHPRSINIKQKDGSIAIYPIDSKNIERKWRFSRDSVEGIINELEIKYEDKTKIWDMKRKKYKTHYKTVWTDSKYSANNHGTQYLNTIIHTPFPYPKSIHTVYECIKSIIHSKENAIILDFFAGSGTSAHAVLKLNEEDGGHRQAILCTNNEVEYDLLKKLKKNNASIEEIEKVGICRKICYPRIKNVMQGYVNKKNKKIEGLGGNLKYFKTDFLDWKNTMKHKKILSDRATELLCLKEDCFELVQDSTQFKIFKNHNEEYIGIIFDYDHISDFETKVLSIKKPIHTYVFSLFDDVDISMFKKTHKYVKLQSIPTAIITRYREIMRELENCS